MNKIHGNVANDQKAVSALEENGWNVITIWECELKGEKTITTLAKLFGKLITFPLK
jgi:DNA mismatch endonuclease (patch repair protein)